MLIDGNFINSGMLEIEVGGFESGMHDFLEIAGTASFLEHSLISFLPWDDYDFSDILPQQSETLEFLYAAGGISNYYAAVVFDEGFLPDGFEYNIFNDGHSLSLEVINTVPIPSAFWLFATAIMLGSRFMVRGERGQEN